MQLSPRGAVLLGLAAILAAPRAAAQTYVWNKSDGSFSDAASWLGAAPPPGGSPTVRLSFPVFMNGSSVVTSVYASNDTGGTFHLNSITSGNIPVSLSGPGDYGFQFDGASPSVFVGRSLDVFVPITLNPTA